jgi:threonine/homoserine/homoserine lactone efflux protein
MPVSLSPPRRKIAVFSSYFSIDINILTESLVTLAIASAVLLGSPGPAVMSLAAVGGSVGFRNGVPYLAGILTGLVCAMCGAVVGVAAIFVQWPQARLGVQVVGAAYLLYISHKIAFAPIASDATAAEKQTPAFRDGLILNILNPKLYAGFFVLFSQFLLPLANDTAKYLVTGLVMFSIAVVVDTCWLAIGSSIQRIFAHPRYARPVRILFGLSIVVATAWALLP